MNTQLHRLTSAVRALLLLAGLLLLPAVLRAATATPPDRISYQGFLVDANGIPLGSNAPVNHTLEFRLYNVSSGGSSIWDEQQVVTIDKGYFSVLLGDGTGGTHPVLSSLFVGADAGDRYVSVKNVTLGSTEMLPRLRLVTSPYAMMAGSLPAGAITNGMFAAASITGDKLATNTLTAANFSTNVGLWTATNGNVYRAGGNVGIGTVSPSVPLSLGTSLPVNKIKLALYDTPTDIYGLGVVGGAMTFHVAGGSSTNEKVRITSVGNVGIGRSDPAAKLHVYGNGANEAGNLVVENADAGEAYPMLRLRNNLGVIGGDGIIFKNSSTRAADGGPNTMTVRNDGGDLRLAGGGGVLGIMVKSSSGFVGIGTATPSAALDVVGGSTGFNLNNASYYAQGGLDHGYTLGGNVFQAAIKASWHIYSSTAFYCGSDARIKNVQGLSDSADDLRKLTQIEITDYLYKDQVVQKSGPQKKVIAQQVEKVFPQAVSKSTDVVPDIFQKAIFTNSWVELATDLKVGERVKLMGEHNGGIHEVLEVREGAFRTAFKPTNEKVFVYGREVKDFHTVDYDALSMLNVSATQELARKVKAQETELTGLRAELAKLRGEKKSLANTVTELKAQDEARESRLARLEKALDSRPGVIEAKATTGDVIGASK